MRWQAGKKLKIQRSQIIFKNLSGFGKGLTREINREQWQYM
jgi:hypothetical protein